MIRIRPSTARDLPAMLRLLAILENDPADVIAAPAARKILATMRRYPSYRFYVATDGRKIVGTYALLIMDTLADGGRPAAIVEDVAVDPEHQGKGVGRAMMQHAMRLAKRRNCFKLVLSSNLRRKNAHAFYRNLGFTQHGVSFRTDL